MCRHQRDCVHKSKLCIQVRRSTEQALLVDQCVLSFLQLMNLLLVHLQPVNPNMVRVSPNIVCHIHVMIFIICTGMQLCCFLSSAALMGSLISLALLSALMLSWCVHKGKKFLNPHAALPQQLRQVG